MKSDSTDRADLLLSVFLCHSVADKEVVRDLFFTLRSDGFDPWLDEEKLLPGQNWRDEIQQAIRKADVVLVCLSQDSITKAGFVQKEIKYALDAADHLPGGTIFIVPLKIEECEVPERLQQWQWVSMDDPRWYTKLLSAFNQRAESLGIRARKATELTGLVTERYTRVLDAASDAISLLDYSAKARRIRIELDIDREHRSDVPRDILALALTNLISNSIKAVVEEGSIRISTEADTKIVRCHITDNGPGVDPDIKEKIFEIGLTTRQTGTGIGLYLSKRVIREHHGDIVLAESSTRGSRFTILLPRANPNRE